MAPRRHYFATGSKRRAVVADIHIHVMVRQPCGDVEALVLSTEAQPEPNNKRYY